MFPFLPLSSTSSIFQKDFWCSFWNIHEHSFKMFGKQGGKYINLQSNLCAFQVTDLLRHFVHLFQSLVIDCSMVSPHSILVKLLLLVGWIIGLLHNTLLICCLLFGNTWYMYQVWDTKVKQINGPRNNSTAFGLPWNCSLYLQQLHS